MEFPHDILPRINPLIHNLATTHSMFSLFYDSILLTATFIINFLLQLFATIFVVWYGTTPRLAIMEPKLIKEILLNKFGDFPKTEINSFTKLFATGLASYDGHK